MKTYFYKLKLFGLKFFGYKKQYYKHSYYKAKTVQYKDISHYLSLYEKSKDPKYTRAGMEICYSPDLKFGCSMQDVKNHLYKPNFHIQTNKSTNIFFYRLLFGNYKVRCQMHFSNNELFHYNYCFSHNDSKANEEVIKIIKEKYAIDSDSHTRGNIFDNNNNCIQIDDDVVLKINYISLNSDFFKKIASISEEEANLQKEKISENYRAIYCKI